METERRASKAFARTKQLWIWAAALVFSYVDLVTTVVVGLQYLSLETTQGTHAAHVTFIMLGISLGLQTAATYLTGMQLLPLHRLVCICRCYFSCKYSPWALPYFPSTIIPGQGALASLATIFGAKPLWDTFHQVSGRPALGSMSADTALSMTRFLTVAFDSL